MAAQHRQPGGDANQSKLARACGVSRGQVNRILNGKQVPSLSLAFKMADYYGVTLDALARRLRLREVAEAKPWQRQAAA